MHHIHLLIRCHNHPFTLAILPNPCAIRSDLLNLSNFAASFSARFNSGVTQTVIIIRPLPFSFGAFFFFVLLAEGTFSTLLPLAERVKTFLKHFLLDIKSLPFFAQIPYPSPMTLTEPSLSMSSSPSFEQTWIIDQILPQHVVGLLVGGTGVGKTSFAIPWLDQIERGLAIWGKNVNPQKVLYISCDRSKAEYYSHVQALGLPFNRFPFVDQTAAQTTIERCMLVLNEPQFRGCNFLFIDGFARMVPGGKISDYSIVADFLCECASLARRYKVTIIGCLHAGKERDGSGYVDPRDKVCGSTAWIGFSNMSLVMHRAKPKDPDDPIRVLHVLTRGAHGDQVYQYQKTESGLLVPWIDPEDLNCLSLVRCWLQDQGDRMIPKSEIIEQGSLATVTKRTLERWMESQIESGRLRRAKHGFYQWAENRR